MSEQKRLEEEDCGRPGFTCGMRASMSSFGSDGGTITSTPISISASSDRPGPVCTVCDGTNEGTAFSMIPINTHLPSCETLKPILVSLDSTWSSVSDSAAITVVPR